MEKKRKSRKEEEEEALQREDDVLIAYIEKKQQEADELDKRLIERKKVKENLKQKLAEMHQKAEQFEMLNTSYEMFLLDKKASDINQKTENLRKKCSEQEETIKRLRETYAQLLEKERLVQRNKVYENILERVHKTYNEKFLDLKAVLVDFEESIDRFEMLDDKQKQLKQKREELLVKERSTHRNKEPPQSHQPSNIAILEAQKRQTEKMEFKEGKSIQKAILELYQMVTKKDKLLKGASRKDTKTQLHRIKMFIQTHNEVVKRLQAKGMAPPLPTV
ncbi:coiled-coil domain-containing protein 42 like-2-like [Brachionichthys hirsutus]|uniref:coiled-coil domain-containing protein 42 like-2-like n=1 Tax=Brachionichthys hirsutus TaxID=412623 RepID=UPI0036046149